MYEDIFKDDIGRWQHGIFLPAGLNVPHRSVTVLLTLEPNYHLIQHPGTTNGEYTCYLRPRVSMSTGTVAATAAGGVGESHSVHGGQHLRGLSEQLDVSLVFRIRCDVLKAHMN
jgi:hypothetical protein